MDEYIAIPKALFSRKRKNWKMRLFVFSVLADMADEEGKVEITRRKFCEDIGINEREYRTAIDSLISDGFAYKYPTSNPTSNPTSKEKCPTSVPPNVPQVTHLFICSSIGCNKVLPTSVPPNVPQVTHQPPIAPILSPPSVKTPSSDKEKETEKENLPPTPPIKEKEKEKESCAPKVRSNKEITPTNLRLCPPYKENVSFSSDADASSDANKVLENLEVRKKRMRKRMEEFYNSLVPFVNVYGRDMIRAFYDYWSEPNKSQTQMRFELQRTWKLSLRLAYWEKREKQIRKKYETKSDRKARANAKVAEWLRGEIVRTFNGVDEEEPLPI